MTEAIFLGTAEVEIQGSRVLEFVSVNKDQAEFDVIGISNPKIRLIVCRPTIKKRMRSILKTGKVEELVGYFNKPARITLLPEKTGRMIVKLEKTRAKKPRHMLWIAIGISKRIPIFDYKSLEIQQMKNKTFALFSLYKRPKKALAED